MQYNLRYLFEISNLCSWILKHIYYKFIYLYTSFIYIRHSLCNPRPIQFIDFLYVIYQRIPYSSCKWLTLAKMLFIFCTLKNCECRISSRFEKLNFLCIIFFHCQLKFKFFSQIVQNNVLVLYNKIICLRRLKFLVNVEKCYF